MKFRSAICVSTTVFLLCAGCREKTAESATGTGPPTPQENTQPEETSPPEKT